MASEKVLYVRLKPEHRRLVERVANDNAYVVSLLERADQEWRAAYARLRGADWTDAQIVAIAQDVGPMTPGLSVDEFLSHLRLSGNEDAASPTDARDLYLVVRQYHSHDETVRHALAPKRAKR